jgi:hypothetical protein
MQCYNCGKVPDRELEAQLFRKRNVRNVYIVVTILIVIKYSKHCTITVKLQDTTLNWGSFKPGSSHVRFAVDKVAPGQVFSEYFGFPCQSSFHQFLHNHPHLSSGAGTIGQ